jgi:hypothetical protein
VSPKLCGKVIEAIGAKLSQEVLIGEFRELETMLVCSLGHSESHFRSTGGAMASNSNAPETPGGIFDFFSQRLISGAEFASTVVIVGGYHLIQNSRTDVRVGVAR